ncbi:MAG: TIGR02281 family clan AA aspartic protease [Gammaproteobacteria bacterium]|nr:TIGR02281 family clan AA aspartic protease [Gammaproteobacteria bacterium]NIR85275.1 TIGR02281 family clan AA aspartic protease [Gammaproteobacteria bacterium]NIR88391.1 TIGR02281 family clan AA aspartic protease [Gammaproteobacteria bacterium]NIU06341.1 TIGR02281 family clan AA aspartic protease [Gammaproteobacteria bacterium]NIV53240.1 TIGR02281 family clan AA aspartic protease [Gammaproteobacteria bacterium]
MIALAWVLLLGLLTVYFGGFLERQHNPNQRIASTVLSDGAREVVLKQNRSGHYVASGAINHEPVVFLLDTGATTVSVPAALADRLDLPRGAPVPAETAAGVITTYSTRLDRVTLGNIVLYDILAHINPKARGEEVLLGMSFLKHLELRQQGDTLTLRQRP